MARTNKHATSKPGQKTGSQRIRAGYARNYLLPRNLAVEATAGNVKGIDAERAALLKKEARERATAESQAQQMAALELEFKRKTGEQGALYGSVTSMDVAEALQERGYEIDRHRIHLRDPLKRIGEYTVPVRLHREVTIDLKVRVAPEGEVIVGHLTPEQREALTPAARTSRHDYTKLIGIKVKTRIDLVKHVEKGLDFTAVEALQQHMNLATKEMAKLLDIKFRTLLRRKEAGRLQPAESDRVLRASRLFARAKDLFDGDQKAARSWLMNPQRALGGAVPLEIAKTEVGAREVEKLIGRLEQGVFT